MLYECVSANTRIAQVVRQTIPRRRTTHRESHRTKQKTEKNTYMYLQTDTQITDGRQKAKIITVIILSHKKLGRETTVAFTVWSGHRTRKLYGTRISRQSVDHAMVMWSLIISTNARSSLSSSSAAAAAASWSWFTCMLEMSLLRRGRWPLQCVLARKCQTTAVTVLAFLYPSCYPLRNCYFGRKCYVVWKFDSV